MRLELSNDDMSSSEVAAAFIAGGAALVTSTPPAGWAMLGVGVSLVMASFAE